MERGKRGCTVSEQNKSIARKLLEEVYSQGKLELLNDIVAPDCRLHDPVFPSLEPGINNLKKHVAMIRKGFPDIRFQCDDVLAERDEVVIHWTASGTHRETFLGMGATNRAATVSGTSIYRIEKGKIGEMWSDWNLLTLLSQLGLATIPEMHTKSARA